VTFTAKELSVSTLQDFEKVAAAQGGCWCMYYHRTGPVKGDPQASRSEANRRDKRKLVADGRSHAIIVYADGEPAGWCQYGRADELPRIDARRTYNDAGGANNVPRLWRITCFFVARRFRRQGVSSFALKSALRSIRNQGGGTVESYPVVSKGMRSAPEWMWFGTPAMFEREGFKMVAALGTSGVLMRRRVRPQAQGATGQTH
jgi:GNAT superfamily N-acetyltransferase